MTPYDDNFTACPSYHLIRKVVVCGVVNVIIGAKVLDSREGAVRDGKVRSRTVLYLYLLLCIFYCDLINNNKYFFSPSDFFFNK